MESRKLNWKQACAILGCGRDKFYRLIRSGDLPAFRAGKRGLWVRESDVRKLLVAVNAEEPIHLGVNYEL